MSCDSCGTSTPNARSTEAVDCVSALSSAERMRLGPFASAANMSARCVIDLSPGTRMSTASVLVIGVLERNLDDKAVECRRRFLEDVTRFAFEHTWVVRVARGEMREDKP